MKSSVEVLEDNKVKVNVEVDEVEFEREVDAAFKRIAKEVRLPGFRPGKAPRRLLEARIGVAAGREEALRESVPSYYTRAVIEHEVDVIAPPEIDITAGRDAGAVVFDAVVEVRPRIAVGGYRAIRVEIPAPFATDDDMAAQLDRLRSQQAELVAVERPAQEGDHVTIDIEGRLDEEALAGLTTTDYDYVVGSGVVVPEIDDALLGAEAGAVLDFPADHPDPEEERELTFHVVVKEVKERVLPEVDDEFAEAAGYGSAAELRDDIATRVGAMKKAQARMAVHVRTQEELAKLVVDEVPPAMVSNQFQNELEQMSRSISAQGVGFEQYLAMTGATPEQVSEQLRESALMTVKVDLALRAVAEAEGLAITDAEIDEELAPLLEQGGQDIDTIRTRLRETGQLAELRSSLQKKKALEWLLEQVEVVDETGAAVDRAILEPDPEPEADADTDAESATEAEALAASESTETDAGDPDDAS